jgi:serpin B
MTYAGADGETRREMAAVLHYPGDEAEPAKSLRELQSRLDDIAAYSAQNSAARHGAVDPITYVVANRLFGQTGYGFRDSFTGFIKDAYAAPLQLMDFRRNAEGARVDINGWVEKQTQKRIRDLIPSGGLSDATRLVLVNAIYLKAPWLQPFSELETKPRPFRVNGTTAVDVPTMSQQGDFGYAKRDGYTVVTIPYTGEQLQFLILLPDSAVGLRALEAKVTPDLLAESATVGPTLVILDVPKLKMDPPVMALASALQSLGMKTAFDDPPGSANFDRMAPRTPEDYLLISAVFHKTFLAVDEKGTEAAAATAVDMITDDVSPQPIEVKVDRPFLFAIQHRGSGACLFLGRVTDPR